QHELTVPREQELPDLLVARAVRHLLANHTPQVGRDRCVRLRDTFGAALRAADLVQQALIAAVQVRILETELRHGLRAGKPEKPCGDQQDDADVHDAACREEEDAHHTPCRRIAGCGHGSLPQMSARNGSNSFRQISGVSTPTRLCSTRPSGPIKNVSGAPYTPQLTAALPSM